jgi:predicted  nucleic acid-binding Zn-ribbon protein
VPGRLAVLLLTALVVLGVAACGGDDGDGEAFRDEFPELSERIAVLGEDVARAIETAGESSDRQLAEEFEDFAQELGDLRQELDDLEPPEELADEREDLVAAMGDVRVSLGEIAAAAEDRDPQAAREATLELVEGSRELRDARDALTRAVRGDE